MVVEQTTKIILDPILEYKAVILLSEDERFTQTVFSTTAVVFESLTPYAYTEKQLVEEVLPNLNNTGET